MPLVLLAFALPDADIQAVIEGFEERRDWALRSQAEDPYPESGVWRYADFALAALYLNERVDEANEAILTIHRDFPVDPDPEREPGEPEREDFHWYINLLHRIWFLFAHDSRHFPGRLSTEAEEALLDIFWQSAWRHCRIQYADTGELWRIWGSENHGAMSWSGFWGTAQILKGQPAYRDRRYEDGSTPAEMAAAWDAYFENYCRERAGKGLLVEIASTYNKYTLQGWYNMADFADDPVLKDRARMLLDLFWADWAIEQIDGVRGGAGHRVYPGRTSTRGAFSSGSGMAWFTFGIGGRSKHPGHLCCATSDYRPPPVVVDMALDVEGRGSYAHTTRRPGLARVPKGEDVDWFTYVLRDDFGGILRYTWATPVFVMGTSQVEARPWDDWANISSQNRWSGVIFAGHPDARIFLQPEKPEHGSEYNSHWSAQHRGTMIAQKLRRHKSAKGQRIWFADCLEREEADGWVLVRAPRAYAAVRVVTGEAHWETDSPEQHRESTATGDPGEWLVCEDEFSPVILDVSRASNWPDYAAFREAVLANPIHLGGSVLRYRGVGPDAAELTFHTDESRVPEIDGEPLDYAPERCWDSPFIQGELASGRITLQKDERRLLLDFEQ